MGVVKGAEAREPAVQDAGFPRGSSCRGGGTELGVAMPQ